MTLPELRGLLIRQQAEHLKLDIELHATPVGTDEFGRLLKIHQEQCLAMTKTKESIRKAQTGSQSSLL